MTYAEGGINAKALADCHHGARTCKAVFYLRPYAEVSNTPFTCRSHPDSDALRAASEGWYLHQAGYSDAAHRIWGLDLDGCVMYAMNPNSASMQAWWLAYLRSYANEFDMFFIDQEPMDIVDATSFWSGGGCDPRPSYCRTTEEIGDDAALVAAHVNFANAMNYSDGNPMHFVYQQAYAQRTKALDLSAFAATNRFVGVTCEGCITNDSAIVQPSNYGPFLDEMAAVNATHAAFVIISDGDAPAGSATQILQRSVTAGITWLAYSEGHTIVHPNLERYTNNLAIWPEDLIYPSAPIQTMTFGAADLQVSAGVWRREFGACYQMSRFFGHCAALLNSTHSAVAIQSSWLTQSYRHVVTLSGGDVLSGGQASINATSFTPNATTIPATGAVLLAQ